MLQFCSQYTVKMIELYQYSQTTLTLHGRDFARALVSLSILMRCSGDYLSPQ